MKEIWFLTSANEIKSVGGGARPSYTPRDLCLAWCYSRYRRLSYRYANEQPEKKISPLKNKRLFDHSFRWLDPMDIDTLWARRSWTYTGRLDCLEDV